MKIKAILFDMDGVLVDSEPLHFEAHRKALAMQGINITHEDYKACGVCGGRRHFYEVMQEKYNAKVDIDAARKMKMEAYGELIDKIILMEGVKNKLEELHKLYRMTIVSNTHLDYIHKTLQHVGIEKYFEAISSAKDFPHGKPYPEVYLDSLQKLDLGANECVAVEDSHAGVEAAKNASIACIAIPNELTKHQDFSHADIVIPNIAELTPELINKIAPSFQF